MGSHPSRQGFGDCYGQAQRRQTDAGRKGGVIMRRQGECGQRVVSGVPARALKPGSTARAVGVLSAAALMLTGCVTLGEEDQAADGEVEEPQDVEEPDEEEPEEEPGAADEGSLEDDTDRAGDEAEDDDEDDGEDDDDDGDDDEGEDEGDEDEDGGEEGAGPAIEQDILSGYLGESELPDGWSYYDGPTPYLTEIEPDEDMISYDFALDWSGYAVDETCEEALADIDDLIAMATGSAEAVVYDDGLGTVEVDVFTSDRSLNLVEPYGALPEACPELASEDGDEAFLESWDNGDVGGFWAEEVFAGHAMSSGLAVWDGDGVHFYMFLEDMEDKAVAEEYLEAQIEALEEIDFP